MLLLVLSRCVNIARSTVLLSRPGPRVAAGSFLKLEPPTNDHLDDQMVGVARHAYSDAKVELPIRRHVEINRGKNLLLLVTQGIEVADWTEPAVVLQPANNPFRKRIADLYVRRELKAQLSAGPFQSTLDRRIEREIPPLELLVDNRPNLPGPRVGCVNAALIANLVRDT